MEQLFGALSRVIASLEPDSRGRRAIVFAAWRRIAGEAIRERTAPLEYDGERLMVAVTDDTWQQNLEALSPQMVAKVNRLLVPGTVKRIEFRVETEQFEKQTSQL